MTNVDNPKKNFLRALTLTGLKSEKKPHTHTLCCNLKISRIHFQNGVIKGYGQSKQKKPTVSGNYRARASSLYFHLIRNNFFFLVRLPINSFKFEIHKRI